MPAATACPGRRASQPARIGRPPQTAPEFSTLLSVDRTANSVSAPPDNWLKVVTFDAKDTNAKATDAARISAHPRRATTGSYAANARHIRSESPQRLASGPDHRASRFRSIQDGLGM